MGNTYAIILNFYLEFQNMSQNHKNDILIYILTLWNLYLAGATHNFKWVNILVFVEF